MSDCKIVERDGLELVEFDEHAHGLGLQVPEKLTLAFPPLESRVPLLSWAKIRSIVESQDFDFGRVLFDSSWITNQNGYGSCAGYGAASALAKARVINGQSRVDLSGDYQYSRVNGGRDRGSMLDDNMKSLVENGCCTAETVPLGGIYPRKYNKAKADTEARRFKALDAYAITGEQSMATALALQMPVVVAIHVDRNWRNFDRDDVLAPSRGPGNHCEHVDDIKWSSRRGCFLYRKATSHGRNYSGDGYCWTTWNDHYKTPSRYHMFYAVPAGIQDPEADILRN
ncbi:MAG: C1 family peptidase [Planctomycetota bacterium]